MDEFTYVQENKYISLCLSVCMFVCMHSCMYMYACMYTCICACIYVCHSLSQQGVWVSFWTPKHLKITLRTPKPFCEEFFTISFSSISLCFFHIHIIPLTLYKDIMTYRDEFIHVHGWNLSILWSPLNIWTLQNFTTANFGHPVSKSWLRPWCM